jgi:hypothetical protein
MMEADGLFRALGFHAGSEILADEEFRLLDGCLRRRHPELAAYLERAKVPLNGEEHPAYFWIRIHTSVEADHFAVAVKGANRAQRYYTGSARIEAVKGWIREGFRRFAGVQTDFMAGLSAE